VQLFARIEGSRSANVGLLLAELRRRGVITGLDLVHRRLFEVAGLHVEVLADVDEKRIKLRRALAVPHPSPTCSAQPMRWAGLALLPQTMMT
jgi:hypothetical protein